MVDEPGASARLGAGGDRGGSARAVGVAPSTVHNRLDPLRVIVRRAIDNDELLVDPCARLKMPIVRNNRTRIEASTTAEALQPLTPHEAGHCAASYMIAAGMDWKKITEFLGHRDVRTTYNRYGKVVPEDLGPAAAQLDDYFERTRARLETSREAGGKTGGSVTGFRPPPPALSGPNSSQIP